MFTPNPEIFSQLDKKNQQVYLGLRILMLVIFLAVAGYLTFLILFPTRLFVFDFNNPNSKKNTLYNIQTETGASLSRGVASGKATDFDAFLSESFSRVAVSFSLDKKSALPQSVKITARKTFKAFAYPEGEQSLGFRDGTLLKNNSNYFIVSDQKLRRFDSLVTVRQLSFNPESFSEVGTAELELHAPGENVSGTLNYPDASLFKVGLNYYFLQNGTVRPFVSESAFLSQYSANQAIARDSAFLEKFTLDPRPLGFADGTLLSSGPSVFIGSQEKLYPIDSEITLMALGYSWNDILPVSEEELGAYEKQPLFTITSPHPDGTIFATRRAGKYFYVRAGQKVPITNEKVLAQYLRFNPILVDEDGLTTEANCQFQKSFLFRRYTCEMATAALDSLSGNNYQFVLENQTPIQFDSLQVVFFRELNGKNLFQSLASIKKNIIFNYNGQKR